MVEMSGSLAILDDPIARRLLNSTIPARLGYNWTDGSPRVVPIWFHWNGANFVLASPPKAPKLKALRHDPRVALTIDGNEFPHAVLLIRGTATVEMCDGVVPEYALSAKRYFGEEQGTAWVENVKGMLSEMARITVVPHWATILDFQTRFPSALSG
jgi:hypothetical protein